MVAASDQASPGSGGQQEINREDVRQKSENSSLTQRYLSSAGSNGPPIRPKAGWNNDVHSLKTK